MQTTTATVQGTTETILVDRHGLPLYIYKPDTAVTSHVSGQLAALWPPLVAAAPTVSRVTGRLTSVATTNGNQVAYNGHFLYTFISDSSVDNVKTKDLVELGQSIQGMSAGRVTFMTVPTGQTDSEGNEPLRNQDNRALFDAIINDDPLPGENNQNETTTPTTASRTPQASSTPLTNGAPGTDELVNAVTAEPQTITVHVSNSTGQDGLGASAASGLAQHGFKVLTPDDYPSSLPSTTVFFSSGNGQAAATVASAFPNPAIERVTGMGNVVQVVLGQDFNTVNAPPRDSSARIVLV